MKQNDNSSTLHKPSDTSPVSGDLAAALLAWYDEHRRILPWREDPTPYHVWLSEIMLQQTRVEAVKAYYARFLEALPDIAALADAPEDLYNKLWQGLGYYSRVRNLHRGALVIMQEYGGRMPQTADELRKIPGIGEYTAAAVASIAFGQPEPAVDGNLLRIFARLTAYDENIKDTAAKRAAQQYFRARMTAGSDAMPDVVPTAGQAAASRPGDINQALMDLGAMICTPGTAPACGECPLRRFCTAHAAGIQGELPVMPEKKARKIEELTVFLIHDAEMIALRKRGSRGLLAGLYEYPNVPGHLDPEQALEAVRAMGFAPLRILPLPDARHIFTHREWHMTGYEILADELAERPAVSMPSARQAADEPAERPAAGSQSEGIFLASIPQIRDVYAIPSAFSAFTAALAIPKAEAAAQAGTASQMTAATDTEHRTR